MKTILVIVGLMLFLFAACSESSPVPAPQAGPSSLPSEMKFPTAPPPAY